MEELRGHHGTWRLDDEMVRIRFDSGRKVPTLFKSLGSCAVPLAAVADVEFDQGDRKPSRRPPPPGAASREGWATLNGRLRRSSSDWRLRLRLADGTDPYAQLGGPGSEAPTPLVLTGPNDRELLAEYFSDQLASAARYARELADRAPDPAEVAKGLVARPPVQVRTAEGSASFDGTRVRLQWDGWLSSTAKEREKSREYRLSEIESATWYPPVDVTEGYLRIVLRGVTIPEATELENDFFTLASHGTKGGEETLLMAATLNAHIEPADAVAEEAAPALPAAPGVSAEEESVFAKIRELGRLHAEGLLTDEEFSAKKAELLDRL